MGILDDLRMSTGLALEPAEAYTRAFEKGVLLGPKHFGEAADLFRAAAQKLAQANPSMAQRAAANGHLYAFLARRELPAAIAAVQTLANLPWVEAPGTVDEIIEGPKLRAELHARILEEQARAVPVTHCAAVAQAYRNAAYAWVPLLDWRPVTYGLLADDAYTEDGTTRFFFNAGIAALNDGHAWSDADPDVAGEHFALAAQAFTRCGAADLRAQARDRLRSARLERSCWFCGRRVQGLGSNLRLLAAAGSEYFARLARSDRERGESHEPGAGVYACALCAGAIDAVAEIRAGAVRQELGGQVAALSALVNRLESRLSGLEVRSILR
jgi:hypothetical protein